MTCVSVLLLGAYAAIALALGLLYSDEPSWTPYVTVVALAIGCTVVLHYRSASAILLRAAGVKLETPDAAAAELERRVSRLAALADLPVPRIGLADSEDLNAFTVGI